MSTYLVLFGFENKSVIHFMFVQKSRPTDVNMIAEFQVRSLIT